MKDLANEDSQDQSCFLTIQNPTTAELKVKGSRFIGLAFPVDSRHQCEEILQEQRRRYHDATHVCFAYRLGQGDQAEFRYSDAGEPAGTAGQPILAAIEGRNLTNVLVVVVRYFGGTKLGIGGLIRAYGDTAAACLDAARTVRRERFGALRLQFHYDLINTVMRLVTAKKGKIVAQDYSDRVEMTVAVPILEMEKLASELKDASSGQIDVVMLNQESWQ